MAYSIEITKRFEERLDQAIDYVLNTLCAPRAAKAILDEYEQQLERIAQTPDWFPVDHGLSEIVGAEIHRAIVRSYRILYWINESTQTVHLVSFRHRTEDISTFEDRPFSEN